MHDLIVAARRQWWNKRWGKLARRDVLIHYTPEKWEVEAREGGQGGKRKRVPADSEVDAVRIAERFMELGGDEWREITSEPKRDQPA